MIYVQIILLIILGLFLIYWIGRIFGKGFMDGIEKKLTQKFNNLKFKDDDKNKE
jgi:membrane protein DedA with SNARE-associated domain